MSATLLVEIGTEELPPKALPRLSAAFTQALTAGLDKAGFEHATVSAYATPRRLAVQVTNLTAEQPARMEQRRGPAVKAAFDAAGEPTKAALGFARSCAVEVHELGRIKTDQGEWLALEREVAGATLADALPAMIDAALAGLPIPKRMRWGAGDVEFVRPVHWIVVLYGDTVIDCEVLGLRSDRLTYGHRFHAAGPVTLKRADDYAATLTDKAFVIPAFSERRKRIVELVTAARDTIGGAAVIDDALLDEVTALVEWPVVIAGSFDNKYLELPEECLIASMQDHQKYFPVRDSDGALTNRFVTISNIESTDPAVVRDGNERVIRPRLADADFFYRTDRARTLADGHAGLADMLFEKRLGSLQDKTARVEALARQIAPSCNADPSLSARAARLSRCDLLSAMVGEFPELQGTMGAYYAAADGEPAEVAQAIGEFYRPRFAGDDIAATAAGRATAVADRIDTLVGIFGIGSAPTGDKDPYALRRAALGVLRTLIEGGIDLDLVVTLEAAYAGYGDSKLAADTTVQVLAFVRERLRGYYVDRGTAADVCAAVLATEPASPSDFHARVEAVTRFRAMEAAAALAAANKRSANILRKLAEPVGADWSHEHLQETAEVALAGALDAIRPGADALFGERDYAAYLEQLAGLRDHVDAFFDQVMVMSEDAALRANRLALLTDLNRLFTRVADISLLAAE